MTVPDRDQWGTQWEPQPAGLVDTPRYPTPVWGEYARAVPIRADGKPSHWVLWQPGHGALGITRDPDARWADPAVRQVEHDLVGLLARSAAGGIAPEAVWRALATASGVDWVPLRPSDLSPGGDIG